MDAVLPRNISFPDVDRVEFDRTARALDDYLLANGSVRRAALLRYLLQEEMEGRGDSIKVLNIARDVFDKDDAFDPTNNSLIRVEVHRLRGSIQSFFQKHAGEYAYIFHIPTGGYRIIIEEVACGTRGVAAHGNDEPRTTRLPRMFRFVPAAIAIVAIITAVYVGIGYLGSKSSAPEMAAARICPENIPLVAVQFPRSSTGDATPSLPTAKLEEALGTVTRAYPLAAFYTDGSCAPHIHYDLALNVAQLAHGSASESAVLPRYRLTYQLVSRKTKNTVASGEFENGADEPSDRLPIIIAKVINHLFDRLGVVVWEFIKETKEEGTVTDYQCLAMAYRFVAVGKGDSYKALNDCIDDTLGTGTLDAYLLSMKAAIMHYLIVEKMDYSPLPTIEEINAVMDKAEAIDANCSDCLYVKTRMLRHSPKPTGITMLYYLNQIEQNWPYDALLLEHAALIAGPYFGQWDRAERSFERARATLGAPDEFSLYSISRAILTGDKVRALKTSKEIAGTRAPINAVQVVAAAQLAGDANLVRKGKKHLNEIGVNSFADANRVLQESEIEPQLANQIQRYLVAAYDVPLPQVNGVNLKPDQ